MSHRLVLSAVGSRNLVSIKPAPGDYPLTQGQNFDYFSSSGPYSVTPPSVTVDDIDDVKFLDRYVRNEDFSYILFSGKLKQPVTIEVNGKKWKHEAGAPVRIYDTKNPDNRIVDLRNLPIPVVAGGRRIKKNKTKRYRRRNSKTRKYRV